MKNLNRIFLILTIIGGAVSLHSACSDENDCSLAGRPMMYCTIYTINPDNPTIALKVTHDDSHFYNKFPVGILLFTGFALFGTVLDENNLCAGFYGQFHKCRKTAFYPVVVLRVIDNNRQCVTVA